jgi:hypothetical protein
VADLVSAEDEKLIADINLLTREDPKTPGRSGLSKEIERIDKENRNKQA